MIIGGDNLKLSGEIGKKFKSEGEFGEEVRLDLNNPHMITICGKRGSGKSYSLGVIMEELMELPSKARNNLSGFIIDTMGIYWSLQIANDGDELEDSDITPKEYPIKVYYPAGLEDKYESTKNYFHEGFELYPSELNVDDWLYLMDIDETQAQAGLLTQLLETVKNEYGRYYGLNDIINELERTEESKNVKEALLRRLDKVQSYGIFSSTGNEIEEIIKGGDFAVLDLSGAGALPLNVRTILTGLFIRKIYNKRTFERSREEVQKVEGKTTKSSDFPLVWLFLDEAHQYAPSERNVPSTEPLVEWVRQGRRPGLSLVLATQQPGALDQRILSQCDTLMVHRLTAGKDSNAVGSKISELHGSKKISEYMKNIPKKPGYCYVMNDQTEQLVPVKIRARKSRHAGGSAKLEEYL